MAVLSFTCLWRVGEASGVRRRGIEDEAVWFRCNKNGDKVVQRELGPYSAKWARWLRDYGSTGRRRSPIRGAVVGVVPGIRIPGDGIRKSQVALLEMGVLHYRSTSLSPPRSGSGGAGGDPAEWRKTTRNHPKSIKYGRQSGYPGRKDPPNSLSAQRVDTTSGLRRFRSYFGTDSRLWNNSPMLGPSERALYCRMMTRLSDLESRCGAPSGCVGMGVPAPWHWQRWGLELAEWILQRVRDGAVREWCNRLRVVIDLPPSS